MSICRLNQVKIINHKMKFCLKCLNLAKNEEKKF